MAAKPTALEAAVIRTWSPGCMPAFSIRDPYAVELTTHSAAVATASNPLGREMTDVAGTLVYSA